MVNGFLHRLTELTEENISNSLFGADELARMMGISHSALLRKVRSLTGKTLNQFIREKRLQKALELLQREEITAAEVAFRTGFSSATYFSNCFREHFGYPPGRAEKNGEEVKGVTEVTEVTEVNDQTGGLHKPASIERKPGKSRGKRTERFVITGAVGLMVVVTGIILTTLLGNSERALSNRLQTQEKTIAVLPFERIGNDTTKQHIRDGFLAELQGKLGDIKSFTVLQALSEAEYQNILKSGKKPGDLVKANYLITGKVGFDNNKMKVWLYLNENKTNIQILAFDTVAELKDIFQLETEITQTIASKLEATLSPEEIGQIEKKLTENEAALGFYRWGNYYSDASHSFNLKWAVQYYQKAIDLDPRFTRAYLGKAYALILSYYAFWDRREEVLVESKQAIDKALEIDPDLPEAHYVLGDYLKMGKCQAEQALKEYEIVLKYQPNHFKALFASALAYWNLGNTEKTLYYATEAVRVNPGNVNCLNILGDIYEEKREYQKAVKTYELCCEINPWFKFPYFSLANIALEWKGDTGMARKILDDAIRKNPSYDKWDLFHFDYRYYTIDLYEGKYEQAINRLKVYTWDYFPPGTAGFFVPVNLCRATLYGLLEQPEQERAYYDSTRIYLENLDSTKQEDLGVIFSYGIVYAELGLENKVYDRIRQVKEVLQEDVKYGFDWLAHIYTLLGRYPEALEQIRLRLSNQSHLTTKILKLDPRWAPLRNLPEYKKLIREFSAKEKG